MSKPIYTVDIETDPFSHGSYPEPFTVGLFDGVTYWKWWSKTCVDDMLDFISTQPSAIVYAHNGGRFDFFFFLHRLLGQKMNIKNSRIIMSEFDSTVKNISGQVLAHGKHEFRDSFAIMPFALGKYNGKTRKKTMFDLMDISKDDYHKDMIISLMWNREVYDLKTREKTTTRELYKDVIEEYLRYDCLSLFELVSEFGKNFGVNTLTIGSASMRELKKCHTFETLDSDTDSDLRKHYYYGGRVECFEKGILEGQFKVFDVNSMYPFAMMNMKHPIGRPSHESGRIEDSTMLLSVTGKNHGAFPSVVKGKIIFDLPFGTFHVTRHEYDAAIQCGLFDLERVERCINFENRTATFAEFVLKFYDLRKVAKAAGDEIMALFYKFILNSAYGKFGQNPENYKDNIITASDQDMTSEGWEMENVLHGDRYIIWGKAATDTARFNVATGASITGASRSILMRAIASAKRPLYCDTDSIICEDLPLAEKDASKLGAWKLEAECNYAAIAGRKLYALFQNNVCVKQANKGVAITAIDIWNVCCGEAVESKRDAPSFKLDGSYNFISRKVRMT